MQTVRVEQCEGFARTMTDMRTWLDQNGIQPLSFRAVPSSHGGFTVELRFSRREQADRFERAFAPRPAKSR